MCLVECGEFTDGAVDILGSVGMIAWVDVGFLGQVCNRRQLDVMRVDSLAADYNNLGITRNLAGCPDDVF